MDFPSELRYHPEHGWARLDGGEAVLGITDFAQDELGDVVFVELPEVGARVSIGEVYGSIESSKSVSELYSPVTGEVTAVNEDLDDSPEKINDDPYGSGWICKVRLSADFDAGTLLDAAAYADRVGAV